MEITTDVTLRGSVWHKAINNLQEIFRPRTNYNIYMLSMAIGIMYDKRLEKIDSDNGEEASVPRTVLINNANDKLDLIFQAAILSTNTMELTEDDRLKYAFSDNSKINRLNLLTEFANFGVTKLVELIGESTLESMENIKNFLISSVEGRNFDIDDIPDELIADEFFIE